MQRKACEFTETGRLEEEDAPRVLVVEDDDVQRRFLTEILLGCGMEVDEAADGLAAVSKARSGRYALALIDYHLPEVDGLATARLLRDAFDRPEGRPRLIAITASPETLNLREGAAPGAFDATYAKPLDVPSLLSCIAYQLSVSQAAKSGGFGARVCGGLAA